MPWSLRLGSRREVVSAVHHGLAMMFGREPIPDLATQILAR